MNPKRNKDLDRCESVLGDMIISCQNHKRGMSDREKMPPCPEYDLYNIREQALTASLQALEENKRLMGALVEIHRIAIQSGVYSFNNIVDIAQNALEER